MEERGIQVFCLPQWRKAAAHSLTLSCVAKGNLFCLIPPALLLRSCLVSFFSDSEHPPAMTTHQLEGCPQRSAEHGLREERSSEMIISSSMSTQRVASPCSPPNSPRRYEEKVKSPPILLALISFVDEVLPEVDGPVLRRQENTEDSTASRFSVSFATMQRKKRQVRRDLPMRNQLLESMRRFHNQRLEANIKDFNGTIASAAHHRIFLFMLLGEARHQFHQQLVAPVLKSREGDRIATYVAGQCEALLERKLARIAKHIDVLMKDEDYCAATLAIAQQRLFNLKDRSWKPAPQVSHCEQHLPDDENVST